MARPRYTAAKRAREIRKQEERARKLARKHNRSAGRMRASEAEPAPAPIPTLPVVTPEEPQPE
jgi:hypothetical protein